ncbi:Metal tolerance protein 11 [Bulinus truncatus]|nr:Metal tolerance protein 11 [Bulinus truncatus]
MSDIPENSSTNLANGNSRKKKRSKSFDSQTPIVLLKMKTLEEPDKRRLSQGDIEIKLEDNKPRIESDVVVQEEENVTGLLGRAVQFNKVRMTEVAPQYATLRDDGDKTWILPLDLFTSKKQDNVKNYSKRLKSYYKAQNELISAFEDISNTVEVEAPPEVVVTNASLKKASLFSKVTLLINLGLLIAKAVASALSGSISIISSLMDSCLDLVSGSIMLWAARAVKRRDPYDYPQGRTKLEPVAIIILSVFMFLCSVQLIREAIEKIIGLSDMSSSLPVVEAPTFAIAGSTVAIKLALYLVCWNVRSPIVQALAQDHRNDVLSNSVALVFGYLGSENFYGIVHEYACAYLDPIGAILISLYIMYNWSMTGWEQMKLLTGHTAQPDFLSKLTWICFNHHPKIKHIETVRAFHFGSNFLVEVDIILPSDLPLKEAHNIGESLQCRLERVPEVERAFVHVDYEYTHKPLSEHKKV